MELSGLEVVVFALMLAGIVAVFYGSARQQFNKVTALVALAVVMLIPIVGSILVMSMVLIKRRKSTSDLSLQR